MEILVLLHFSAESIFYKQNLQQRPIPVNTLMKGYLLNHRADAAINLAEQLDKNERISATYHLWANAVAQLMDSQKADFLHQELNSLPLSVRTVFNEDCRLHNALINVNENDQLVENRFKIHYYLFLLRWMENVAIFNEWRKPFK